MIHITKPLLGEPEQQAACEAIASGWVTQGPRVAAFERAFADYCGAKHAVAVSNCTTALHLALLQAGIGPGDEVIVPTMTFIATANAVLYCGGTPILAEVCPQDFNLDPDAIKPLINERTKALLPVHQIGIPARMDALCKLAEDRGLLIIEDAACAIGSSYKGQKIGKPFGHSVCFSFHPRKVITTGEGGMITTDDEHAAEQMRILRHQGMSVSDTVRHASKSVIFESYTCVGYNYRMTDIQAAIGMEQLKRLDGIVAARQARAARYDKAFTGLPGVKIVNAGDDVVWNYQCYAILITEKAKVARDDFMQAMLDAGIATRRGITLIHREPPYAKSLGSRRLPQSDWAADHSVLLPMYPHMETEEQDQVIDAARRILA